MKKHEVIAAICGSDSGLTGALQVAYIVFSFQFRV
jgi:hypothetical protein